jgi:hypothetical protein
MESELIIVLIILSVIVLLLIPAATLPLAANTFPIPGALTSMVICPLLQAGCCLLRKIYWWFQIVFKKQKNPMSGSGTLDKTE